LTRVGQSLSCELMACSRTPPARDFMAGCIVGPLMRILATRIWWDRL
jgi:hypothetical protein